MSLHIPMNATAGELFNPVDYGAIPDDGINDLAPIQSAIDDASTVGGTVLLPAGEFTISGSLYMKSNVTLQGSGNETTIRQILDRSNIVYNSDSTNGEVITNTSIRDLKLQGTGTHSNLWVALIAMRKGVDGALLENLVLTDSGYDAWHALKESTNIIVRNCTVRNCLDDGLNPGGHFAPEGTGNVLIENNYIENISHDGIHISWDSYNVIAQNNTIMNCGNGILMWKSDCALVRHNTISGSENYSIDDWDGFHHIAGNDMDGIVNGNTAGDIDCNQSIDILDLLAVLNDWGPCNCRSDITGNTIVDVEDLLLIIQNWSN